MTMQALLVIASGASMVALWWLFSTVYRNYHVDKTRQNLFRIRDELFDSTANGLLDFNSRAYTITRTTLNGMIRFTHELTLTHVISSLILHAYFNQGAIVRAYVKELETSQQELSDRAKNILRETRLRMHLAILDHLVHTSLVLFIFVIPMVMALRFMFGFKKLLAKLRTIRTAFWASMALDAEARAVGKRV